ncbi:cation efflux protein [Meredithblackwellia eburnea MCA 4105]
MKSTTKLTIVLCISFTFFAAEIAIGFSTKSLALIADAATYVAAVSHRAPGTSNVMIVFIVSYLLAWVAARLVAKGKRTDKRSFAYHRAELIGAFFNAVFLLGLALSIFLQSIERFIHVEGVDRPMLVVIIGCIGLALNLISGFVLHDHDHEPGQKKQDGDETSDLPLGGISLPVPSSSRASNPHDDHAHSKQTSAAPRQNLGTLAVLIHVLGDAINNVGVIIAGIIIWKTSSPNRFYADPTVSMVISILIFLSAIPLSLKTAKILLESAPDDLDLKVVKEDLLAVPGVLGIHDLHVTQLSEKHLLATLHVLISPTTSFTEWEVIEETLQECFTGWGIGHATLQPELMYPDDGQGGVAGVSSTKKRNRARHGGEGDEFGCALDNSGGDAETGESGGGKKAKSSEEQV